MSAWLLQRPARPDERHPRYLADVSDGTAHTTPQPLLAMRFRSSLDARCFAAMHEPHFDDWRVVLR
jgi:hypothetical protein